MGYHLREIPNGVLGEFSKLEEEFEELKDANEQQNKILMLVELSDLYGAIECFIDLHFNLTMNDLAEMSKATKRSFESGERVSKS